MSNPKAGWSAWVAKAENDLLAIDNNLAASRVPWDVVAFHAQQVAEKYLKAYLRLGGDDPPKTHDLPNLLALCARKDPTLNVIADPCVFLSRLGVVAGYPDSPAEPTEDDSRKAVRLAREVRQVLRARLPHIPE